MNHRPTPTFANVAEDRAADMTSAMLSRYLVKITQIPFENHTANRVYPRNLVTGDPYEKPWTDRNGITFIGIIPFLLDPRLLETL